VLRKWWKVCIPLHDNSILVGAIVIVDGVLASLGTEMEFTLTGRLILVLHTATSTITCLALAGLITYFNTGIDSVNDTAVSSLSVLRKVVTLLSLAIICPGIRSVFLFRQACAYSYILST
jgi:hypothetical protein